ncbi:hypothetical protein HDU86_003464 [Geranomyces michiganensis]|nr:hypothetical protein HDU86_003464 [Geranomyces michiganensis]
MRNLRPDPRFDDLIRLFRPGLQDAQRSEEAAIARSTQALQKQYEEGMRRQWKLRQTAIKRNRITNPSTRHAVATPRSVGVAAAAEPANNTVWRGTVYHSHDPDDEDDDEEIIVSSPPPAPPPVKPISIPRKPAVLKPSLVRLPPSPHPWSVEVTLIAHPRDKRLPVGEVVSLRTTDQCTVAHMALVLRQYYADLSPPQFATLSDSDFVFALTRAPEGNSLSNNSTEILSMPDAPPVLARGATVGDVLRMEAGGVGPEREVLVLFHTLA